MCGIYLVYFWGRFNMDRPTLQYIYKDLAPHVIKYLCDSPKAMLEHNILDPNVFPKILLGTTPKLVSILLKFLNKYCLLWIFKPEYRRLIFAKFKGDRAFIYAMLKYSITHDDVELFDELMPHKKISDDVIISMIDKNIAIDIACNSKHMGATHNGGRDIYTTLCNMESRDYKGIVEHLRNGNGFDEGIFIYLEYISQCLHIQTDLDQRTKYIFDRRYRNLYRIYLKSKDLYDSEHIHEFLLNHGNMSYLYDYYRLDARGGTFVERAQKEFISKMLKKKNIIADLFKYPLFLHQLYNLYPVVVFQYIKLKYPKLTYEELSLCMDDIFTKPHRDILYSIISGRGDVGRTDRKHKKMLYDRVKTRRQPMNVGPHPRT
jgi:hypothetical protein